MKLSNLVSGTILTALAFTGIYYSVHWNRYASAQQKANDEELNPVVQKICQDEADWYWGRFSQINSPLNIAADIAWPYKEPVMETFSKPLLLLKRRAIEKVRLLREEERIERENLLERLEKLPKNQDIDFTLRPARV